MDQEHIRTRIHQIEHEFEKLHRELTGLIAQLDEPDRTPRGPRPPHATTVTALGALLGRRPHHPVVAGTLAAGLAAVALTLAVPAYGADTTAAPSRPGACIHAIEAPSILHACTP